MAASPCTPPPEKNKTAIAALSSVSLLKVAFYKPAQSRVLCKFKVLFAGVSGFERFVRRIALTLLKYIVVLGAFVVASVADTMREEGGGAQGVCVTCGVYDEGRGDRHTLF